MSEEIFEPKARPFQYLFSDPRETPFIIPDFQRQYTWKPVNIVDFFDDIVCGIRLSEKELFLTFLGAVILSKTSEEAKKQYTSLTFQAFSIIDGQQRFATIMFVASILYLNILKIEKEIDFNEFEDDLTELLGLNKIKKSVRQIFTTKIGDKELNAPAMIRMGEEGQGDYWSIGKDARYISDVGKFYYSVINTIQSFEDDKITDLDASIKNIIKESSKNIQSPLNKICELLNDILESKKKVYDLDDSLLWNIIYIKSERFRLRCAQQSGIRYKGIEKLLKAVAFSYYFLEGIYLTTITTKSIYAFNIFDALNTSGQPLTVLDIFYAGVLNEINSNEYFKDESKGQKIKNYLKKIREGIIEFDKEKKVSDLITFYALAYYSEKIGKNSAIQRKFLDRYKTGGDNIEENTYKFTLNLYNTYRIYEDFHFKYEIYKDKKLKSVNNTIIDYKIDIKESIDKLCIELLCAANPIAFAPLVSFYAKTISSKENEENHLKDFIEAVRIIAAFSTLYRLYFGSTHGIDDVYRKLMKGTFFDDKEKVNKNDIKPSIIREQLYKVLRSPESFDFKSDNNKKEQNPEGFLDNREKWSSQVSTKNVYKELSAFTRFTLLILRDNTVLTEDNGYLLKQSRRPITVDLTDFWDYTIEHVAPQTNPKDENDKSLWSDEIYESIDGEETKPVDLLGNLITLPSKLNNNLSNNTFEIKVLKARYNYECDTEEQAKEFLKQHPEIKDISIGPQDRKKEQSYEILIKVYEGNDKIWDVNVIHMRSKNMAYRAHDCLMKLFDPAYEYPTDDEKYDKPNANEL